MLYTSNLYSTVCQLYLNKTEKKKHKMMVLRKVPPYRAILQWSKIVPIKGQVVKAQWELSLVTASH